MFWDNFGGKLFIYSHVFHLPDESIFIGNFVFMEQLILFLFLHHLDLNYWQICTKHTHTHIHLNLQPSM